MNIAKKTCYSNSPSRLRRSVALISAAILLSTNAQAEIKIGRLPSTSAGSGEVIGAKPNVFLVLDNGAFGTPTKDGNNLQQTAAALITTLPALEGKVRLGYSKALPDAAECAAYKLNGNVDRLTNIFDGAEETKNNPKYVTGEKDFIFKKTGSGYGELIPRDFQGNFAKYIYSWIGALCPGKTGDSYYAPYRWVQGPHKQPPYAELNNDPASIAAYEQAAIDANNENSYPLWNFAGFSRARKGFNPVGDRVMEVFGIIGDRKFLESIAKKCEGNSCAGSDVSLEVKREKEGYKGPVVLRKHPYLGYFNYDAYANTVYGDPARDDGFPDDKDPLSCRKNYILLITEGAVTQPYNASNNAWVGIRGSAKKVTTSSGLQYSWDIPPSDIDKDSNPEIFGIEDSTFPYSTDKTYPYQYIENTGNSNVKAMERATQGSGDFLFSKLAMQGYYTDLRSRLRNDVPAYYAEKQDKKAGSITIPKEWNRENDPANWQHASFFTLGFIDDYESWVKATVYNDNYQDLNPDYPISRTEESRKKDLTLEGYFRSIEDGSILSLNSPLVDWARGGFGVKGRDYGIYVYKNPSDSQPKNIQINPPYSHGNKMLQSLGSMQQMDNAKAGIISRGGAYPVNDYDSVKKALAGIIKRIETATAQGITGGAVGGGGRITASSQTSTPNTLFATYVDEEALNGNIFAYRNCPVTPKKIPELNDDGSVNRDSDGKPIMIDNPEWAAQQCGKRLWNAATVLDNELKANPQAMAQKTIVPIKDASGTGLTGDKFTWATLDDALKTALKKGTDDEATGQARVEWINGKLHSEFDATMQNKLRKRGTVAIPIEGQRYKLDGSGQPEKDPDGNFIFADPTSIANRIGEIVYAVPKAIDNTGTLPSGHPLNVNIGANNYADFVKNTVRKRKPLVMAGSNDGHLYAFTDPGRDLNYAELAFSYIPRAVAIAPDRLVKFTDPDLTAQTPPPNLVNGPFTVRDAQVDGKWGTYVVGTLGPATATNAVEGGTIYALDISNGRADNDIFKWEVNIAGTDGGNPNIMAEPRIVWLRKPCTGTATTCAVDGKWVVLVTSGYNATNTSLVVLDLKDGSELARINTGAMYTEDSTSTGDLKTCQLNPLKADNTDQNLANVHKSLMDVYGAQGKAYLPKASFISCDNGLGALTVFDADNDGGADYVFAGDLFGHVWKFDLTGFYDKNTGNQAANLNQALKVSYDSPLFIAQSPNSSDQVNDKSPRQPITAMIDIADGAYGEGSMLYVGTGRLFNQQERAFSQRQSYYGIWDIPRYTKQKKQGKISDNWSLPLLRDTTNKPYRLMQYEAFVINSSAVKETTSELKDYKELRGLKHKNWQEQPDMTYLSYDLEGGKSANPNAKLVGWSIDFPADNKFERVIERGRVFEDTLFFPSFEPPNDSEPQEQCTPDKGGVGGNGRFYMVDRMTGAQPKISPFDFTGDGSQSKEDGVELKPSDLGLTADAAKKAGYTVTGDNGNEVVSSSVAGILIGPVPSSFLTLDTVLGRVKLTDSTAKCDYNRQVIFPGTLDPVTGQPRILTSCNINRYRVWKQPIEE